MEDELWKVAEAAQVIRYEVNVGMADNGDLVLEPLFEALRELGVWGPKECPENRK